MASWAEIVAAEPELAAEAHGFMEARVHKTIGTVRPDGAPRLSGIEARFIDGELAFGSMPDSPKVRDLARDPRFMLHSGSQEPDVWDGDAKLSGTLVEITDGAVKAAYVQAAGTAPPGAFHLYIADITELVVLRMGDPPDHIVVRRWTPGGGVRTSTLR